MLMYFFSASKAPNTAPDLVFNTLTGSRIELKALKGRPVLVTFWATDCPSCVAEIPQLIDLYQRYHCAGLEIIAIAMAYDPPNHVLAMSKAKQIPYHVVLDLQSEYAQAFGNVMVTPNTFLLAPDAGIASHQLGAFDAERMATQIATYTKDKSCSG